MSCVKPFHWNHSQPGHHVNHMIRKNHEKQRPCEQRGEPYGIRKNHMMRRCLLNRLMHATHQQNRRMCKTQVFPVNHMMHRNRKNHWQVRTEPSRMNRKIRVNAFQLLQSQSERQHPLPEEQNYRIPSSLPTSRLLNCSENVLLPSTLTTERRATRSERLGEIHSTVKQRGMGRLCRLFSFPIVGCAHNLRTLEKGGRSLQLFSRKPSRCPRFFTGAKIFRTSESNS
jgi:hypothetical protein